MGIKEFFKSEATKRKESREEAEFQLYASEKELVRDRKRLEKERGMLLNKYRTLQKDTPEYNSTVSAFKSSSKKLEDCKRSLDIIDKTKGKLISAGKGGTKSLNYGDIVSNAMKQILGIVSSEEAAGAMTKEERDRVAFGIEKALRDLPEDSLDDWAEMVDDDESGGMVEEDYDDTIEEMDRMIADIDRESKQKSSKREGNINKEIEDELAQVRADRMRLEAEAND